jgi:hypothetical protein
MIYGFCSIFFSFHPGHAVATHRIYIIVALLVLVPSVYCNWIMDLFANISFKSASIRFGFALVFLRLGHSALVGVFSRYPKEGCRTIFSRRFFPVFLIFIVGIALRSIVSR